MKLKLAKILLALAFSLPPAIFAIPAVLFSAPVQAREPVAKDSAYHRIVDYDFVKAQADIPPKPGVVVIDSRPAERQYDAGHIPGAISIPDSQFDTLAGGLLPADREQLLIFYCGDPKCLLAHQSAYKAEKLGYTNVHVYATGYTDWVARGGGQAVSAAYIKKLTAEKSVYLLIDTRPRRTAEKGVIPGAVNIPDGEFDKHVDKLPLDKATLLVFYCGGLDCVLSRKSAEKARALGYQNIKTYPEGYPEWTQLSAAAAAEASAAATAVVPAEAATVPASGVVEPPESRGAVDAPSASASGEPQVTSEKAAPVRAKCRTAESGKKASGCGKASPKKSQKTLPATKPAAPKKTTP